MSSFHRQHHGRSRPPPDRNWSGYHPPSSTVPQDADPHYLQYFRSQAEQLNRQLSELTQTRNSHCYNHYTPTANIQQMAPAQVSIPSSNHCPRSKTHRNPAREKSKWRFYAVKNRLNGDDEYSSWGQAHPYCWDPKNEYFFQCCFCFLIWHSNMLSWAVLKAWPKQCWLDADVSVIWEQLILHCPCLCT